MRRVIYVVVGALLLHLAASLWAGNALTNPAATYKDLLHLDNSNAGVTSSLQTLVDGAGNDTGLSISTTGIGVPAGGAGTPGVLFGPATGDGVGLHASGGGDLQVYSGAGGAANVAASIFTIYGSFPHMGGNGFILGDTDYIRYYSGDGAVYDLSLRRYNDGTDTWLALSAENDTDGDGKLSLGELQVGGTASGGRIQYSSPYIDFRNSADDDYNNIRGRVVAASFGVFAPKVYENVTIDLYNGSIDDADTSVSVSGDHDVDDEDTSGESVGLSVEQTYDIEDAGDDHPTVDLLIDRTETAVDSDVDNELIAARVGGADVWTLSTAGGQVTTPDTLTVADSGDGNPATGTWTPASSYCEATCNDSDGCTVTVSETGATEGHQVEIINVSANAITISDSSGVTELDGNWAGGQYDSLTLRYIGDRWVESGRSDN
jgi:hypothetical protein